MSSESNLYEQISAAQTEAYLATHSIFLFDEVCSKRLAIARMSRGWTQADLAREISFANGDATGKSCSQTMISRLERRTVTFQPQVTIYALQVALGKAWRFVVFGKNQASFDAGKIIKTYWLEKFEKAGIKGGKVK